MFRQTRSQVILNALQSKVPVTGVFASFTDSRLIPTRFKKADDADRLLIRLCQIQDRLCKPERMHTLWTGLTTLEKDFGNGQSLFHRHGLIQLRKVGARLDFGGMFAMMFTYQLSRCMFGIRSALQGL